MLSSQADSAPLVNRLDNRLVQFMDNGPETGQEPRTLYQQTSDTQKVVIELADFSLLAPFQVLMRGLCLHRCV